MAVVFEKNYAGKPARVPNMTGHGDHSFHAWGDVTALDSKRQPRDYRVAVYQIGDGSSATLETAIYINGRMMPENQLAHVRAEAEAAYRATFLGLTEEVVTAYRKERARLYQRVSTRRAVFAPAQGRAAYVGYCLGRVYQALRQGKRVEGPKISTWGRWNDEAQGERYLSFSTSSQLIRFVGYADEIGRINHKGWFTSEENSTGEKYRGAVWQLSPDRAGRPRFVAGYVENMSGEEGGFLDLGNIQTGEPGGEEGGAKMAAAYLGDQMAERDAENARDYGRAWQAGSHYAQALEEAQELKGEVHALLKERIVAKRELRALGLGTGVKGGAICAAIDRQARALLRDLWDLKKRAQELAQGDDRNLWWSPNDRREVAAFIDGAQITLDQFNAI